MPPDTHSGNRRHYSTCTCARATTLIHMAEKFSRPGRGGREGLFSLSKSASRWRRVLLFGSSGERDDGGDGLL